MRSILALLAATWFVLNAMNFVAPSVQADSSSGQLVGEDAAVAITVAARTLFAGLTLLSLAVVEWEKLWRVLREAFEKSVYDAEWYADAGPVR